MNGRRSLHPALASLTILLALAQPPGAAAASRPEPHAAFAPPAARAPEVLTARARQRIGEEGTAALWVFFTDKGERDAAHFTRLVREAGAMLTDRSRDRRARENGGAFVPDYYDVPVPQAYVDAVASSGARVRQVSRWLNAVSVEADDAAARRIAAYPFVRVVTPVARSRRVAPVEQGAPWTRTPRAGSNAGGESIEGTRGPEGSLRGPADLAPALDLPGDYGSAFNQMNSINSIAAQDSGFTGAGVVLAMFDTGYRKTHSALSPLKRIAEWDFIFHDGNTANEGTDWASQWDHGTGTWSVAGGYAPSTLVGPAFNASFLLAKTEDVRSETPVEEDNWVAAAEWADSIGADVISSSLAYLDFDPPNQDYSYTDLNGATTVVTQAAVYAHRRGILVANAMGNQGPGVGSLWAPADADSILSCGAVDASNVIANFSSRGPTYDGRMKPEVVAQGVATAWAIPGSDFNFGTANGTSLSTPLIAGAAVQVREAHPEWTVQQIRLALRDTADRAASPNNDYGWGRINVVKAIYGSVYGGPVFPKPFSLLLPANNATVTSAPVTLRWRKSADPNPGDVITYTVQLCKVSPASCIFTTTTTDTFVVYNGYLGPSTLYEWSVTAADPANHQRPAREEFRFTTATTTDVAAEDSPPAPMAVVLRQSRPNPTSGGATIEFGVGSGLAASTSPVTLRIFDAGGRLVRTLLDAAPASVAGLRTAVRWDGSDESGRRVASGIYHYQLSAAGRVTSKRMIVIR
jgi:hypothetical protein